MPKYDFIPSDLQWDSYVLLMKDKMYIAPLKFGKGDTTASVILLGPKSFSAPEIQQLLSYHNVLYSGFMRYPIDSEYNRTTKIKNSGRPSETAIVALGFKGQDYKNTFVDLRKMNRIFGETAGESLLDIINNKSLDNKRLLSNRICCTTYNSAYYSINRVDHSINPTSKTHFAPNKTYAGYIKEIYKHNVTDLSQPMILTGGKESCPKSRHPKLIPEFCLVLPISADIKILSFTILKILFENLNTLYCFYKEAEEWQETTFQHYKNLKLDNQQLLKKVFTLPSYANENEVNLIRNTSSNQALEWLGDGILKFISCLYIYQKYPNQQPDALTSRTTKYLSNKSLKKKGKKISIFNSKHILSSATNDVPSGENMKAPADCMEAFIGALYLEKGLEAAAKFISVFIFEDDNFSTDALCKPQRIHSRDIEGIKESKEVIGLLTRLGIKTQYPQLYQKAFIHKTHPSFDICQSYERMEFLGDAVLQFLSSVFVFHELKDNMSDAKGLSSGIAPEGILTLKRKAIVQNDTLKDVCINLGMEKCIKKAENVTNDKIYGDVVEAFICALYFDKGLKYDKQNNMHTLSTGFLVKNLYPLKDKRCIFS